MKISPTILNSCSALGLGSVSQCALGRQEKGPVRGGAGIPRTGGHTERSQGKGSGNQERPVGGMEFSSVFWPFR